MAKKNATLEEIAKIVHYLVRRKGKPFLLAANAVFDKHGITKMENTHDVSDLRGVYMIQMMSLAPFMKK